MDQQRAQNIISAINANRDGGNIKRFLTEDEHKFVMAELREGLAIYPKLTYMTVVYNIAYPKPVANSVGTK